MAADAAPVPGDQAAAVGREAARAAGARGVVAAADAAPVPVDQAAAVGRGAVQAAGARGAAADAAPVPVDQAAAVGREAARAAGATEAVIAAAPVRAAVGKVTVKDMDLGRVAQAPVATQGHGTSSAVAIRDRGLIPTPEASG